MFTPKSILLAKIIYILWKLFTIHLIDEKNNNFCTTMYTIKVKPKLGVHYFPKYAWFLSIYSSILICWLILYLFHCLQYKFVILVIIFGIVSFQNVEIFVIEDSFCILSFINFFFTKSKYPNPIRNNRIRTKNTRTQPEVRKYPNGFYTSILTLSKYVL